ncbi:MAG TPA: hypothetical protein VFP55_13645 [Solirubrobacteraceae bacterium]|nr:hypothetical protein [Solirubrobacteraceae bacterium]
MTAFNALLDGYATSPDPGPLPTDSNGGATMGATMGPTGTAAHIASLQGTPPYTGPHNTPLQVAFLGLIALGVVILLRKAGFRFSVAGKLSAGGR